MTHLQKQKRSRFAGAMQPVRYSAFLRECAQSKVCVDPPGRGPFCFQLVDYFAFGTCAVAAPRVTVMPDPPADGEHLVDTKPGLANLIARCASLGEGRERLAADARYFDRYLKPWRIGPHYLHRITDALN